MAFWGNNFIFDDVTSETYGLFIVSINMGGTSNTPGSGSVNMYTKKVYRNPKVYLYGTEQTPPLQFQMQIASLEPLCATTQALISKWLFGKPNYKQLKICQDDYQNVYFNCILNNPQIGSYGNFSYTISFDVICDSPFAWEYPKTITKSDITSQISFILNNTSDSNTLIKPKLNVYLRNTTSFYLENDTIGNRFEMTDLSPNEILTIDGELGVIRSNKGFLRYDNKTGRFFELAPKVNNIRIGNDLEKIEIIYQNARRMSG